eukprot:scaffold1327_cov124-Cylindrotheca_fusiformis.AAC.6
MIKDTAVLNSGIRDGRKHPMGDQSDRTPSTLRIRAKYVVGFISVVALSFNIFEAPKLTSVWLSSNDATTGLDNMMQGINLNARKLAPCLFNKSVVCRFDDIGRFLEDGPSNLRPVVHQQIQAVPSYRRIPHAMANNRTHIASGVSSFPNDLESKDASNATLNEYNPTILPLYKNGPDGTIVSDLDQKLLDDITGRYHPGFSDAEADEVQYLLVTRSSNHYPKCIPGGYKKGIDSPYDWVNYPGLALLDKNLQPIAGADVLIDIEKYYFKRKNTRTFQDFSIFAARTTKSNKKKDHLFLMTNGVMVLPIAIRRVPPGNDLDESDWQTKIEGPRIQQDTMYGTGLQVRMTRPGKPKAALIKSGKNMHVFESSEGMMQLEVWPHSDHVVSTVNFFWDSFSTFRDYTLELQETVKIPDGNRSASLLSNLPRGVPTVGPANRGTGCCADLTLSDGRTVKLGISHLVVKGLKYLHRFYAFVPEKPFQVLSLSGLFCLGDIASEDRDSTHHWISQRHDIFKPKQTTIGSKNYDCPSITFATGITNMIGHGDNYIIISYGVNDCYSRSIMVHKKKIEMLLFPDRSVKTSKSK